jgi:inorganic pyrophosphatase/exopolyphosphatase
VMIAGRLRNFVEGAFPLEARLTFPEAALLTAAPIVGHQLLFGNPAPASDEKIARDAIELRKLRVESEAKRLAKEELEKLERRLASSQKKGTQFSVEDYGAEYRV